ncbi:peptidase domain-containing ABC transporter [Acetobacteraceae bacterium]|nr:peptidase domain-containing ABC transporter [Acetobacteraceae bacterium]
MQAVIQAARFHGVILDPSTCPKSEDGTPVSPAALARWANESGCLSKAMPLNFQYLVNMGGKIPPLVLMFRDGSAALMVGASAEKKVLLLQDPWEDPRTEPVPIDELRLMRLWRGETLLIKRRADETEAEATFDFNWFAGLVLHQKKGLRDVLICSLLMSILQLFPGLIVMQVADRVVNYHSMSTLVSLSCFVFILSVYEVVLTHSRQELVLGITTRLDARISLYAYDRLLSLPLEFYEREQTGEIIARFTQIFTVRNFMTGPLLNTFLDLFVLIVILPVLFYLSPVMAWLTLVASGIIGIIAMLMLPFAARVESSAIRAEMGRNAVLYETVAGIRTVKTMALESTRKILWDEKSSVVVRWRLAGGRMANWISTAVQPFNLFINRGIILVGAYIILTSDSSGMQTGTLMAFMMLGGRVAAPLVNLARLTENFNEVRVALAEAGAVLNQPTELKELTTGLMPQIKGEIHFADVNFSYPGSTRKALNNINFHIPAGTMLGLVGKSGSGKSTITRLLQGVSRDYTGFLRLDGMDLREINLSHLRRSEGSVLQDNFLFRGTIADNIIAGRPGLTMEDVMKACRMAEAEEFIEKLPAGYETFIEEGCTNISGGQRQRLAIARALANDPKLMILDEATSALDPESEAIVNANLERIGKGRTMVIVSHRLSSLVRCDKIAVLEQGKLVDIASHAELVERCEIYQSLWNQQNEHMLKQLEEAAKASVRTPDEKEWITEEIEDLEEELDGGKPQHPEQNETSKVEGKDGKTS